MFGAPKESVLGSFDSKSERRVARALFSLVREGYLRGVLPHPVVAGCEADFGVQLGGESFRDQGLMIVEYDGLGLSRPSSLETKQRKYARLRRNGLYVRWATSTEKDALKRIFTPEYSPPSFVRRVRICDHGHEQTDVVIGEGDSGEVQQLISSHQCPQCDEQPNDDSPASKD